MTQKDLVVSADGHILEPHRPVPDPAAQATSGTGRCGRRTSRSSRWSKEGSGTSASSTPPASRAGRCPATARLRRHARHGDPDRIVEDLALDGIDAQLMHPNLSLFGLYSDDHELSMAHARVYNDYIIERFSPYFTRLAPTAAGADHRRRTTPWPRSSGSPPAGFRAILLPAIAPTPYYSRRARPGVGGGSRPTGCTCSSTPRPAG